MLEENITYTAANVTLEEIRVLEEFCQDISYYQELYMHRRATAFMKGKTIKEYPKSDKVSSAMLKQGMAFLELGDKTAGKILLNKVVKAYPNSNQSKIAKSKLARIR